VLCRYLGLAARLREAVNNRAPDARLLLNPDGASWRSGQHRWPFTRRVSAAGLDPAEVPIYALRHSNIVRQLLAGVPVRVVAVNHDTSVTQIERTCSRTSSIMRMRLPARLCSIQSSGRMATSCRSARRQRNIPSRRRWLIRRDLRTPFKHSLTLGVSTHSSVRV
jgi:hypothetical protein